MAPQWPPKTADALVEVIRGHQAPKQSALVLTVM